MPEDKIQLSVGTMTAIAGLIFTVLLALASAVGNWYVMITTQSYQEKTLSKMESDFEKKIDELKETNRSQWQRLADHNH